MGQLAKTHQLCFQIVNDAIDDEYGNDFQKIKVSVGDRVQGNNYDEVTVKQSTFDVLNLSNDDFTAFEYDVSAYSRDYVRAATIADVIYDACPGPTNYVNFDGNEYQIVALDMFMQYTDRDDYEASCLIRIRRVG